MEILVMIKGAMQEVIMLVNIDKGLEYWIICSGEWITKMFPKKKYKGNKS